MWVGGIRRLMNVVHCDMNVSNISDKVPQCNMIQNSIRMENLLMCDSSTWKSRGRSGWSALARAGGFECRRLRIKRAQKHCSKEIWIFSPFLHGFLRLMIITVAGPVKRRCPLRSGTSISLQDSHPFGSLSPFDSVSPTFESSRSGGSVSPISTSRFPCCSHSCHSGWCS